MKTYAITVDYAGEGQENRSYRPQRAFVVSARNEKDARKVALARSPRSARIIRLRERTTR